MSRTLLHVATIALGTSLLASAAPGQAPSHIDRTGVADTSVFAPLPLPPGTDTRLASGAPGPRYWQNLADYDIHASLDTATASLTGALRVRYTNHSPDTLKFLWFQLEQNRLAPRALRTLILDQARLGHRGFEGGDVIDRIEQVGAAPHAVSYRVDDTEMQVWLPTPVRPGGVTTIEIRWHFPVSVRERGDRMGRDGALYEMAQWYPRVNVYDDLRGWNTEPYLGPGEFYLEYGDFRYAITLPAGYVVAGTGVLDNPEEVLTATERARLNRARVASTPVPIITSDELTSGAARPRASGALTWRFHATNVRDVAWAAAPNYRWDAVGWHGIPVYAFYRATAPGSWAEAADMARMSIDEYSRRWFPYPYPQVTVVEGPVDGQEYPMLAMESAFPDVHDLYYALTHEVGHNWFPMLVGSNERMHAWMDEGFNMFINESSLARRYPDQGDELARFAALRAQILREDSLAGDPPIETPYDRLPRFTSDRIAYFKPAVGLQLLRQEILGPEAFDAAFRTYIARWANKHPAPADFFRTIENVSGRRLDWFWREFWLENRRFDQALDRVAIEQRQDTSVVTVTYANRARGVLPIRVRMTFSDGGTQEYAYPAEVWARNAAEYHRTYAFVGKRVTRIELDPDHRLLDIDRTNNIWTAP